MSVKRIAAVVHARTTDQLQRWWKTARHLVNGPVMGGGARRYAWARGRYPIVVIEAAREMRRAFTPPLFALDWSNDLSLDVLSIGSGWTQFRNLTDVLFDELGARGKRPRRV